jgi:lysophospholipase L1-like esterase
MSALSVGRGALLLLVLTSVAYPQIEPWDPVSFISGGKDYMLVVRCMPSGESFVVLSDGKSETVLGGAGGENLFPVAQVSGERFYVLWVHYQDGRTGLGLYDSGTRSSYIIPLPGLKFAGSPVLVEQAGQLAGLVFLGNASDNDDVFFCDLTANSLANVTRTAWSEKWFATETGPDGILLRAISLRDRARYLLRPGERAFRLLGRESLRGPEPRADVPAPYEEDCRPANTYAAFGDSITYGKMRMVDLEGEIHPELAYPERMREALSTFYGPAYPLNLGVLGDSTYDGALRVDRDLAGLSALYFVLMMGTNDCINGWFSVDSSIENLAYIIDAAAERGMRVIVSTIPPRKDAFGDIPFVLDNIAAFNLATAGLAAEKRIGFIDTHGTFMATNPPDGWKDLLEDIGGNHPSPAGHIVIAGLFADVLAAYPPLRPTGVENVSTDWPVVRRFRWDPGCESDLSCYRVEFGPFPPPLKQVAVTNKNWIDFPDFPSEDVYFRVQAVDAAGHRSGFTRIFTTAEEPRGRRRIHHPNIVRQPPRSSPRSGSIGPWTEAALLLDLHDHVPLDHVDRGQDLVHVIVLDEGHSHLEGDLEKGRQRRVVRNGKAVGRQIHLGELFELLNDVGQDDRLVLLEQVAVADAGRPEIRLFAPNEQFGLVIRDGIS